MRKIQIHIIDTEARTIEEAVDIIWKKRINRLRSSRARKSGSSKKPLTLAQEFGGAKGRSRFQKMRGEISLALGETSKVDSRMVSKPKTPHPYKDLSLEQQRNKCREMYDSGNGFWGWGSVAHRRLAKLFSVPLEQIVAWLENEA